MPIWSMKTLKMFSVLPAKFDADFYFKIDDDVAVNVDAMATYLQAQAQPRGTCTW